MNNAGIGQGALRALDFYSEGDKRGEYVWDKEGRTWRKQDNQQTALDILEEQGIDPRNMEADNY